MITVNFSSNQSCKIQMIIKSLFRILSFNAGASSSPICIKTAHNHVKRLTCVKIVPQTQQAISGIISDI